MAKGKVHIVGAGPGDPKLLTLKGLEVLRMADVVIHHRLVSEQILKPVPTKAMKVCAGEDAHHNWQLRLAQVNELMVRYSLAWVSGIIPG